MLITFLILTIAFCFLLRGWATGRHRVIAVLCVLFIVLLSSGPVARWVVNSLQAGSVSIGGESFGRRATIILLGGGLEPTASGNLAEPSMWGQGRILRTAALYRQCKSQAEGCTIIVSGGDPQGLGVTEAARYASSLQSLGVPAEDIRREDRSRNTWQNAQNTAPLLRASQSGELFLVTSAIHVPRALLYFSHFGIAPTPVCSDRISVPLGLIPSAINLAYIDVAMGELIGMGRYHLYNFLGWNPHPITVIDAYKQ